MKILKLFLLILVVCITFPKCKKTISSPTQSSWTLDNVKYKPSDVIYLSGGNEIQAEQPGNYVLIYFSDSLKNNTQYSVTDSLNFAYNTGTNNCFITLGKNWVTYASSSQLGNSISIKISNGE